MKLHIGQTGLDYDRDYGRHRRTGWTAVHRGAALYPHLTTLRRALWVLLRAVFRR